jgi:Fur family transcriptional regulator, stress-responsive regulator
MVLKIDKILYNILMSNKTVKTAPLLKRLKERGWRITVQRRTVAEVLTGNNLHLTAEEVFRRAKEDIPEISRATVYNILGDLVGMGEIGELQFCTGSTLYDPNAPVPHHHMVCTQCGKIYDVQPKGINQLDLPKEVKHGFSIDRIEVVFRGQCSACS